MARVTPPTISPAPTPAPQRGDRATFSDRVDAFVLWLSAAVAAFQALATNVYNNAVDAFGSAEAAANSAATAATQASTATSAANATAWVSGTSYTIGKVVYSPIDKRSYRRRTNGAGTTDPSLDKTNWVLLSHTPYAMVLLASVTPVAGVMNIDFLNVFSPDYDSYLIEFGGISPNTNADSITIRLANAGVVDSGQNYASVAASDTTSDFQSFGDRLSLATISTVTTGVYKNIGGTGEIYIRNTNSVKLKSLNISTASARTTDLLSRGLFSGAYTAPSAVSGIRFYWMQGAAFASGGYIRIYGYVNSNA